MVLLSVVLLRAVWVTHWVLPLVTPGVLLAMSWLLVPAVRGRRWLTGQCDR